VLLGVTGSGKTFTMAQVIEATQRPALILAPNKILAAQLYGEMKSFFPDNAVEYFVSYYDYYQPEAYVARSDTYIEKESSVNEAIDRMRHSATRALLERDDVIIVASVSCLYGIGSVETYSAMIFDLETGKDRPGRDHPQAGRHAVQAQRCGLRARNFRVRGDNLEIFPSTMRHRLAHQLLRRRDRVDRRVRSADRQGGRETEKSASTPIRTTSRPGRRCSRRWAIRFELAERLKELNAEGKLLEAQRLEQRTNFDLEMIAATGSARASRTTAASSRPPARRATADAVRVPPENALLFVDESHQTIPRSARWRAATTAARSRWPNMASACQAASTTARCASTSGRRCARRPLPFPPRPAPGRWSRRAACSRNR
jgi:excinuclease ABC subunit B